MTDAEVKELFEAVNQLIKEREYKSGGCAALIDGVWYEGEEAEKAIAGNLEKMSDVQWRKARMTEVTLPGVTDYVAIPEGSGLKIKISQGAEGGPLLMRVERMDGEGVMEALMSLRSGPIEFGIRSIAGEELTELRDLAEQEFE